MKNKVGKGLFSLAKTPIGNIIVGLAFGKFDRLLPINRLIDNEYVVAFWHPKPAYKKHILIVPKKSIKNLSALRENEIIYINEVFKAAKELVKSHYLDENYSIIMNGGSKQKIPQLHFHLVSK